MKRENKKTIAEKTTSKVQEKRLYLLLSDHLYHKLEKHINRNKSLNPSDSKKSAWVEKAIIQKLSKDGSKADFSSEKSLNISIANELFQEIVERVNALKMIRGSYSIKKWLVEAISSQLDAEDAEDDDKTLLAKLKKLSKTSKS
jgi:hypothetical protein